MSIKSGSWSSLLFFSCVELSHSGVHLHAPLVPPVHDLLESDALTGLVDRVHQVVVVIILGLLHLRGVAHVRDAAGNPVVVNSFDERSELGPVKTAITVDISCIKHSAHLCHLFSPGLLTSRVLGTLIVQDLLLLGLKPPEPGCCHATHRGDHCVSGHFKLLLLGQFKFDRLAVLARVIDQA